MMHEGEKSDSAIVAAKPPNKAGRPAAGAVERRAGTEGNAGQQSTLRPQIQAGVSQASRSAMRSPRSTSRKASRPPSEESCPPSKRAISGLPPIATGRAVAGQLQP